MANPDNPGNPDNPDSIARLEAELAALEQQEPLAPAQAQVQQLVTQLAALDEESQRVQAEVHKAQLQLEHQKQIQALARLAGFLNTFGEL